MKAMDIDAVKAFVLAPDLQSFTRAADVLGTSQSAISLKLQRLEEQLGRRLLDRTPRRVRLSAEGQLFLGVARELVLTHDRAAVTFETEGRRLAVGISHQLVGRELPALLRRLHDHDPNLLVEMRVAGTQELMQAYERGAQLLAHCRATLASAEQRLRVLDDSISSDSGEPPERSG